MGINKRLSLRELMFGFEGRIGRLALLRYTGILGIGLFVFILFSLTFLQSILQHFNLSVASVGGAIAVWPAAAIVCKRLHDMKGPVSVKPGRFLDQAELADRSGLHSMGICSLLFIPLGWLPARWAAADIIVLSILATWLALAPGTSGPNIHGLESGMRVDRVIDKPRSGT